MNKIIFILPLLFIFSCTTIRFNDPLFFNPGADWYTTGGSGAIDNISKSTYEIKIPLINAWEYNADAGFSRNCITVSDATAFVSTLRGDVTAFNIKNGEKLGNFSVDGLSAFSSPRITGKNIFFTGTGEGKNYLYSYSHVTGSLAWKRRISQCESSPVITGSNVIITCTNGIIFCFDAESGRYLWQYRDTDDKFGSRFYTTPAVKENMLFAGSVNGCVYAVDGMSGKLAWKYRAGGAVFSDISLKDGRLFFGCDDGNFYCIDSAGRNVWKNKIGTRFLSSSTFYGNTVITGGIDGCLYSMNQDSGELIWKFETKGSLWASPVLHRDYILIGSFDRYFYVINAENGAEIWKKQYDKRIRTTAAVWNRYVIFGCEDKNIYCLKGN